MTNIVSLTCLSLQIQNSDGGISDFRISSESFMNGSCHNSRTSNDIDMKRVSVSKHDNTNTETSKKLYDDVMSANCDVSLIYVQFGAIWKLESTHMVCNTYIFIKNNLLSYKNRKQNYKISNTALLLLLWIKLSFLPKNAGMRKIKGVPLLKGIFSETTYVLCTYVLNFTFLA